MRTGIYKKCLQCGVSIYAKPSVANRVTFCSRSCKARYSFMGNKNPRWREEKATCIDCGILLSAYNALRCKKHARRGERHHNWKGDKVSYAALHHWITRELGSPKKCLKCDSEDNVQWANISRVYLRDKDDWMPLCAKCHWAYDRSFTTQAITKDRFPEKFT